MSAQAVICWGEVELRVAPSGAARLLRGDDLVLELGLVDATGEAAEFETTDEVEHTLAHPVGHVFQRHSAIETWRSRWVIEAVGQQANAEQLRLWFRPGPDHTLWSWASGVTALLAVAPAHAAGPVLLFRVEQGFLETFAESERAASFTLMPEAGHLEPGQRLVTSLVADWYPSLAAVTNRLPAWFRPTSLQAGDLWLAPLADFGVSAPEPVSVELFEDEVGLLAGAGRRVIDVQVPKGLARVALEWAPTVTEVLRVVARRALDSSPNLAVAEALCVQFAIDAGLLWADPATHDRLDSVDWQQDGTILAAAFGLARGRSLGEAALVSDALRQLEALPVGEGYARVAMAGWIASVSVGLEARQRCLELLGRRAVGRTAALESSLLHYRSPESAGAELAGVVNRLGGELPGEAPLLPWTERARLTGLLELAPPEWEPSSGAQEAVAKTAGQILCGYHDGRIVEAAPLAWLILNRSLGILG